MVLVSSPVAWSLFLGVLLGLGLWSLVSMVPRLGRPSLAYRVAPYVLDVSDTARALLARRTIDPLPVLGTLLAPAFSRARNGLGAALGGASRLELRLRQAGSSLTVERFRSEQLVWALLGAVVGAGTSVVVSHGHSVSFLVSVAIPCIAAATGLALRDILLQRAVTKRMSRVVSEFPTVIEFLTLSLSAGEGILDSLRRVSRVSSGELSREIGVVMAEVNTGVSLNLALENLEQRLRQPAITRLVEQITGALERGSPLAEVLRAQAQDAREIAKRDLLETAGKKEVAMLVPLVFLILPTTIAFAIFPGIFVLQAGF